MKILITGICGFVGSSLAGALVESGGCEIFGVDNYSRPGSELNRRRLPKLGVKLFYGDMRLPSDLEGLPAADWVIDAAAIPTVLGGLQGETSSRQLLEHNLVSAINVLEYCKARRAGFVLLSTSRVYSIKPLCSLPMVEKDGAFMPDASKPLPPGVSIEGVGENFSTEPPLSLYGAGKLAAETLALEYGEAYHFPVWINRCGVLAGAGQFGRPDQGIFSFWLNSHLRKKPLKYIGFGGKGWQARDCLHPRDLANVLRKQFAFSGNAETRICNFGGGARNTMSLLQLSRWCDKRFGPRKVEAAPEARPFDIPWMAMDCARAKKFWGWQPQTGISDVLEEIAKHAEANENWLEISATQ